MQIKTPQGIRAIPIRMTRMKMADKTKFGRQQGVKGILIPCQRKHKALHPTLENSLPLFTKAKDM